MKILASAKARLNILGAPGRPARSQSVEMGETLANCNGRSNQSSLQRTDFENKWPKFTAGVFDSRIGLTSAGFTLTGLLVVIATIAVLSALLLLAVAATKPHSRSFQYLNNLRRLMVGWQMYASENKGYMMPNAPIGANSPSDPSKNAASWCSGAIEGWGDSDANTNRFYYATSIMGS